ncbi:hypothetical protein GCM10023187_21230 [Nibrella viscosa]|uniref:Membrane or secreted protein n=1 Tax=Nibrella viscosa TaxID=1084524 RepID=A0ABP8KCQ6_9BACT
MLAVILVSGLLMLVAFFLFSVRLLFVKGGEFRGTCAGNNPMLNKSDVVCGVCGRKPGEECANPEKMPAIYQTPA